MLLQDLRNIMISTISTGDILFNMFIALICGLMVAQTYKWTLGGTGYSRSISKALVVLSMITAIVIMVIGNNLARAFGLVGAMSIIRFRTSVKDPMDIVFIFFSLAVGLAAGVGLTAVALLGTIGIGMVLVSMKIFKFGAIRHAENVLQFAFGGDYKGDRPPYLASIETYCQHYKLINVRSLGNNSDFEISYYITLKNYEQSAQFVNALSQIQNVSKINLYSDDSLTT
ncbi:DUF4956 domain-containing protein [bacterium]|nr:DUF4956 domain-containing protein [bacterium]